MSPPRGTRVEDRGWHLRKEVSVSHVLTTIVMVFAVLKFGYDMDTRLSILETKTAHQQTVNLDMKDGLKSINKKLDTLISVLGDNAYRGGSD